MSDAGIDKRGGTMHDYPLEELGPRAFEQLIVALALKVLGPGVESFGSGVDGGREATYDGPVNWSATSDLGSGSWWTPTDFVDNTIMLPLA